MLSLGFDTFIPIVVALFCAPDSCVRSSANDCAEATLDCGDADFKPQAANGASPLRSKRAAEAPHRENMLFVDPTSNLALVLFRPIPRYGYHARAH